MFSAPFIDLINGYFDGSIPIGRVVRTLLILANIYLCMRCIPKREKESTCVFLLIVVYVVFQSTVTGMFSKNDSIMSGLNFGTKLLLFLSEMQLLINYSRNGKIKKEDFANFWKFSCWFVPLSLLMCKILDLSNAMNDSKAGLYSSVNAMSIVFIIQFVISLYFSKLQKKFWLAVILNILAVALLGTKSPYLYIGAVIIALVIFYSKHRIRMVVAFVIVGCMAYYLLSKYFAGDMLEYIEYQTYHLQNNLATHTILDYLFSGRNNMLAREWKSLLDSGAIFVSLLFGIGRTNFASAVEMDFFEILFGFGIPVTIGVYYLVLRSFSWKCSDKAENLFLNLALICMISFSTLGGHTFLEAIAATYSAILIGYRYSCHLGEGRGNP